MRAPGAEERAMARHTTVDSRFGVRMREIREARGLSLRALASRALSNKSQLQAFEVGNERPTIETARRIDEALGADGALVALVTIQDRPGSAVVGLEFASSWPRAVDVAVDLWRGPLPERRAPARQRGSRHDWRLRRHSRGHRCATGRHLPPTHPRLSRHPDFRSRPNRRPAAGTTRPIGRP